MPVDLKTSNEEVDESDCGLCEGKGEIDGADLQKVGSVGCPECIGKEANELRSECADKALEIERLQRDVAECRELIANAIGDAPETFPAQSDVLRDALQNISTVMPLEHFPAVTALAYCRQKAIEALNATPASQEVIIGEYDVDGKLNIASSPLPEGTKLYARLPLNRGDRLQPETGERYPCACPEGSCGVLIKYSNQFCRLERAKAAPKAAVPLTVDQEWENAKAAMSGEKALPPCECLVRDKKPSAYHNEKCPRFVADLF